MMKKLKMNYNDLKDIFKPLKPYEEANSVDLWSNEHIAKGMLEFHLNPDNDPASRNKAFVDKSIEWLVFKFHIDASKSILDLGCGPGLYSQELARQGAKVTGIDISENSIRYAKKSAEEQRLLVQYRVGDYISTPFEETYDLIILIYDDYCALSPEDRKIILKKIHNALTPGGFFIFDVLTHSFFTGLKESQSFKDYPDGGFWAPEAHFVFEQRVLYPNDKIFLEKHVIVSKKEQFVINNYLQCFSFEQIQHELQCAGLSVAEVYSDVAGADFSRDSKEMALVVQRL